MSLTLGRSALTVEAQGQLDGDEAARVALERRHGCMCARAQQGCLHGVEARLHVCAHVQQGCLHGLQ